ncbi:UNVERIFIED_CONTAM: hypothetical protein FKN15_050655 [Acipenser sinensis]
MPGQFVKRPAAVGRCQISIEFYVILASALAVRQLPTATWADGEERFLTDTVYYCDKERMNPNQQSPSRPVRALYNRNCGLRTEWLGSSFRGQSEAGHSGRGRRYGTWSHRPSTTADATPGAAAKSQPGPEST